MKNLKFLKNFDLIQNDVGLMIDGNERKQTNFGAILTIIIIILTTVSICMLGEDILKKENPTSSYSKYFQDFNYLNFTDNFPIMVSLVQRGAVKINDHRKYFDISFVNFNTFPRNLGNFNTVPFTKEKYSSGECEKEDLNGFHEEFYKSMNPNITEYFFCLKQKQRIAIHGSIGQPNNSYIAILVNKCTNSTRNNDNDSKNIICKTSDEIQKIFESIYISVYSLDFYVDVRDFEKPIKPYVRNYIIPMSYLIYKRQYIYYKNIEMITDKGWIFPEFEIQSQYQVDYTNSEIFLSNSVAFTPDTVAEITIAISRLKDVYKRSYYKLQNLAADIGGILKFIMVFFIFLNYIINRPIIEEDLFSSLFNLKNLENKEINHYIVEWEKTNKKKQITYSKKSTKESKNLSRNFEKIFHKFNKNNSSLNHNISNENKNINKKTNEKCDHQEKEGVLQNFNNQLNYSFIFEKSKINTSGAYLNANVNFENMKNNNLVYNIDGKNQIVKKSHNCFFNKDHPLDEIECEKKNNTYQNKSKRNTDIKNWPFAYLDGEEKVKKSFNYEKDKYFEFLNKKENFDLDLNEKIMQKIIINDLNLIYLEKKQTKQHQMFNNQNLNFLKIICYIFMNPLQKLRISYVRKVVSNYLDIKLILKNTNDFILLNDLLIHQKKDKLFNYFNNNPLI